MNEDKKEQWQNNHMAITYAYEEILNENLAKNIINEPTVAEISRRTNISRVTIYKHLENFNLPDLTLIKKLKSNSVLNALVKKASSGDVQAIKLYTQLFLNWSEKNIQQLEVKEVPTIKIERVYRNDVIKIKSENDKEEETENV